MFKGKEPGCPIQNQVVVVKTPHLLPVSMEGGLAEQGTNPIHSLTSTKRVKRKGRDFGLIYQSRFGNIQRGKSPYFLTLTP